MDYLSLFVTAKIMHVPQANRRMVLSAGIGALYSVAVIAFGICGIFSALSSIAISLLMSYIAYGKQSLVRFAKNTAVFYAVSFALGGGITAICNLLNVWQNSRHIVINGTYDTIYGDLPFGLLVLLGLGCSLFSFLSGKLIKKQIALQVCELEIGIKNSRIILQALVDSGNLLKEPISGKPVVIVTLDAVRSILPVESLCLFRNKDINIPHDTLKKAKIRFIPTSTVGGHGLLLGFIPDLAKINGQATDTYIAIDCDKKSFGDYTAIVPRSLVR